MDLPRLEIPKLEIGATLPGEAMVSAIIHSFTVARESMSQDNRDAFDRIQIAMLRGWVNWWVERGWPGEKV
jgi:hypothetical protein